MKYLLCIDIGNTRVKLALMQAENLLAQIFIESSPLQLLEEYRAAIKEMLKRADLRAEDLSATIISSVVPRLTAPFTEVCRQISGQEPLIVDSTLPLDLKICYDDPTEVGADRICNAIGALRLFKPPLIVLDMGTATTFDIISSQREYLGGLIMPGLETAGKDLFERTALLPEVPFAFPEKLIGSNTRASLQSGLMWGSIAQIDGLIDMICEEWQEKDLTVVATGGLSEVLARHSRYIRHLSPNLTLIGMLDIWEQLRGKI